MSYMYTQFDIQPPFHSYSLRTGYGSFYCALPRPLARHVSIPYLLREYAVLVGKYSLTASSVLIASYSTGHYNEL
jgi:hypothetical protein